MENNNRDFYKVLLVSQSGKGKTYSFRNMNPETTGFINVEHKPLPFKNAFKYHGKPQAVAGVFAALKAYMENPEITCIVIDSLSAVFDMILAEARATKKGFDIWNNLNDTASRFVAEVKKVNKEVFLTAHYEWIQEDGVGRERRVKIKGKELEGVIEKDFTIVLYADRKINDDKKIEAWFDLSLENSSAKCPPDIFGEGINRVPNDSNEVLKAIIEFIK